MGAGRGHQLPAAQAERLPLVTARHTEVDHQLAVLDAALGAAARIPSPAGPRLAADLRAEWRPRLAALAAQCADPGERQRVRAVLGSL